MHACIHAWNCGRTCGLACAWACVDRANTCLPDLCTRHACLDERKNWYRHPTSSSTDFGFALRAPTCTRMHTPTHARHDTPRHCCNTKRCYTTPPHAMAPCHGHGMTQHGMCTAWHSTACAQHDTAQHDTARHPKFRSVSVARRAPPPWRRLPAPLAVGMHQPRLDKGLGTDQRHH